MYEEIRAFAALANVSSECMEALYGVLRQTDLDLLRTLWLEADPWTTAGALLRYQISFTVEKKLKGEW